MTYMVVTIGGVDRGHEVRMLPGCIKCKQLKEINLEGNAASLCVILPGNNACSICTVNHSHTEYYLAVHVAVTFEEEGESQLVHDMNPWLLLKEDGEVITPPSWRVTNMDNDVQFH